MAQSLNFTDGSIEGMKKQHATTPRGFKVFTLRNRLDFTLTGADLDAAADVVAALNVAAGTIVLSVQLNVLTVDANGATFSVGVTGVDTSKWGSALAVTPVGVQEVTGGPVYNPLYFATADTIDLLSDGGGVVDDAIIEIIATCVKSSNTIDAGE